MPLIFGRAAIALGIGPHSSCIYFECNPFLLIFEIPYLKLTFIKMSFFQNNLSTLKTQYDLICVESTVKSGPSKQREHRTDVLHVGGSKC